MNHPPGVVLSCLRALMMNEGMTAREAIAEMGEEAVQAALRKCEADRTMHGILAILADSERERQDEKDLDKALALWAAGWTTDQDRETAVGKRPLPIYSWAWRRPAIPPRTTGRRFASTDQAYRNLTTPH